MRDPNYYVHLEETLTGRMVPMVATDDEFPVPYSEKMTLYYDLQELGENPKFANFLRFVRQRADETIDKFKAANATEGELRFAKAFHEFAAGLGVEVVKYIAEIDRALDERKEWLAEKAEPGQTTTPP